MSTSPHRTEQAADAKDPAGGRLVPRVREIVAAVATLDPDEVGVDDMFYDDLLIDSLQKLEIVVRIERGFGVKMTDEQAAGLGSVADAVELLLAKGITE